MTTRVAPSQGAVSFFTSDHRACDEQWALVEKAVDEGDAARAREAFATFDAAMRRHLEMEESVLFPAFEARMGSSMGPTQVMRMEHERMRGLLTQMASAAASNVETVVDLGDTLLMLVQQHNVKEEGVLYPMADRVLGAEWAEVAQRLERLAAG